MHAAVRESALTAWAFHVSKLCRRRHPGPGYVVCD
jgi:hypothetical protein